MNRIRFTPKVLALAFMTLLSVSAYAWYNPTRTYSATVQVGLSSSSTGGGLVYVDSEATDYTTVSNSDWRPNSQYDGCEGGNSSNTQNAMVDVYLYAKANPGYQFDGWSSSDTGEPANEGDLVSGVYRSVQRFQVGNNDYGYWTRDKEYTIYAFFSPKKYEITYDANGGSISPSTPQEYTIKSTDALRTPTKTGYTFSGWKVTQVDSNEGNWTLNSTASSPLSGKYGNVTLTAQWTPTDYTIKYLKGDHGTGTMSGGTYSIEDAVTLAANGFTPDEGYLFDKWKVTSVTDGNWTANSTFEAGETVSAGKYGNVEMTALWKTAAADITISVSGLDSNDSAIFTVSNGGGVLYTVALSGSNPSVKIKDLPTGVQYTVQATNAWSLAYGDPNPVSHVFGLGTDGYTASFTYTKDTSAKKHDEDSKINWKPQTP